MKRSALFLASLTLPLSAQLRITEVMSDSAHSDSGANGDWFEITNTGATAVNLAGYAFDDDSEDPTASGNFPSVSLAAGASLIVLNEDDADTFRDTWNLAASLNVITRTSFTDFPGFGRGGDEVFLFDPNNAVVDSFAFGAATEGFSFARFSDGTNVPGSLSSNGLLGASLSTDTTPDIASPGVTAVPPAPLPPFFNAPFFTAAVANSNLVSLTFRVASVDPNPGNVITITSTGTPAWLTVNDLGGGRASFSGTPPTSAVGSHEFQITATDNTNLAATQTYRIEVLAPTSPIILNEYNAVSADEFIGGGDEETLDGASDPTLGRIAGNGGPWVEFVVTQTTDLRDWTLTITGDATTRTLQLSDHIALSAVPAGTILTFTESQETSPTGFNINSQLDSTGFTWTNIWMFDPILIDQANSVHPSTPAIGSNNTTVTWSNATGDVIYGPSGESIALQDDDDNGSGDSPISVSANELFRLEANPASNLTPLNLNYDDGNGSTFGGLNIWSNETMIQSFTPFVSADTPPFFGIVSGAKAVRGDFQLSIPSGAATQTIISAPSFLTITQGNLIEITNNRPLTAADIGTHEITLSATSGTATNYLVFPLVVQDPSPALILNEYNAVADDQFLNGGILTIDDDGGVASSDSHFNRVLGNGGNWFELALVGNGAAGFTNLTNWTIEVGSINDQGSFLNTNTITLSDSSTWSSVAHGTILTFIDENTANGGLDTGINLTDNLSTDGYAWTNINLSTPGTVTTSAGSDLEINSSNTAFLIRNAAGVIVFGPAGEGIAPLSGVGGSEIFELENDPSPLVSSCDVSSTTALGYDDGSSGSTFGSPNLFAPLNSTTDRAQDFSAFISVPPLDLFLASFGLTGADLASDPDRDGFSILEEYLFGGDPTDPGNFPTTSIDPSTRTIATTVRVDDPNFTLTPERGTDLINWFTDQLTVTDSPSPLGASYVIRSFVYTGSDPKSFFRVSSN